METNLAYKFEEDMEEEIIGGKVVMMASPTMNHIFIAGNIYNLFFNYLRGKKCTPFPDGTTLFLGNEEKYKPDVMVVCDPDKTQTKGVFGAPDLAVEVLSPSSARNDRGRKKDVYEKHGVREYWIVNPADRSLEQYVLEDGRFVLRDVYTQHSKAALDDMDEDERAKVVTEFKCSLFDDLTIRVEDIFYRVIPNL